jgi:wyosine [tRNA(Phe)-imidazoG37] synthetase (radical SAM superfamily)
VKNYTFGPVLSRRFGLSLGIDLSPHSKICNFDCIYCELEKAKPIKDYVNDDIDIDILVSQVKSQIEQNPSIDVITITANGEPTMFPRLNEVVDRLNEIKKSCKLLILSNSSTIMNKDIQKILHKIDIVKLSLDTIDQKVFRKIDRSIKEISIDDIMEGILEFKHDFKNELIIEVLVVKDINDKDNFEKMGRFLHYINPNRVDLSTIDRPPAYDVKPVYFEVLENISKIFSKFQLNVNIASRKNININKLSLDFSAILHTLSLRAFTQDDINQIFSEDTIQRVQSLIDQDKIYIQNCVGVDFYRVSDK